MKKYLVIFFWVQSIIAQSFYYQYHYITYLNNDTLIVPIQEKAGTGQEINKYYIHKGVISKDGKYLIGFLVDEKEKKEFEFKSTELRRKMIEPNFKDLILVIYSFDKNEIIWYDKVISNATYEFVQENLVRIRFLTKDYLLDLNNIEIGTLINRYNTIKFFDNKIFKIIGGEKHKIVYEFCNKEKIFKHSFEFTSQDQNSSNSIVAIYNENVFLESQTLKGQTELLKVNNEVNDTLLISDYIQGYQDRNFLFIASTDYQKAIFNLIQFEINTNIMDTILTYSLVENGRVALVSVKNHKDNLLIFLSYPLDHKKLLLFDKKTSRIEELVSSEYIDEPIGFVEK